MKRIVIALSAALTVAAFAQADPGSDWRSFVAIQDTKFDADIKLENRRAGEGNYYGQPARASRLVTLVNKSTGAARHLLVFEDNYDGTGWRFWGSAATDKAVDLTVLPVERKVGTCGRYTGCSHFETIAVVIPEKTLRDAASASDVQIRMMGRGFSHVIALDQLDAQRQIAATQAAADQVKDGLPK